MNKTTVLPQRYNYELYDGPNIDCEDDFHAGCRNVGLYLTNNSTSQDYTNQDGHPTTNSDSPGFRSFTVHVLLFTQFFFFV